MEEESEEEISLKPRTGRSFRRELTTDLKSDDDGGDQLVLWSPAESKSEIEIEAIDSSDAAKPGRRPISTWDEEEIEMAEIGLKGRGGGLRSRTRRSNEISADFKRDQLTLWRLPESESESGVVLHTQPERRLTSYRHYGRGLMEAIENEPWEEAKEMHLMNKKISKLPENPNCPELSLLFLQANHHLRVIPPFFFKSMHVLQTLNLSQTGIKSLPESLFQLVQLRTFILRGCQLFKELSDKVGQLCHLEVLDLEGTEIIELPTTVGKLTKLTCLKVSFYCKISDDGKNHQSNIEIIPHNVISSLPQLEELSIDVNPEDERWNVTVKHIVNEICCLNWLRSLKLYLPEVELLNELSNTRLVSTSLSGRRFRLTVGSHQKCIIHRLPQEFATEYEEKKRCLKYVNGKGVPTEIKNVLQCANSLFLDRHLTVTRLSEFGIENMKNLKFCVLKECNEIVTIVEKAGERNVLGSLEYLNLHYLNNIRRISMRPLGQGSLFCLKALKLYSCPQLTTIFTLDLLEMLRNLEELVVEDCPEINSIVSLPRDDDDDQYQLQCFLPKLKKISLHYMPKLVSIACGVWIGPRLEWLSCYDCPRLRTLYPEELTSADLKVVIGEANWFRALNWEASEQFQPPNLDGFFVPIERDTDLMTQLARINYQLQAQKWKQKTKHSQQSDVDVNVDVEEQSQRRAGCCLAFLGRY